MHAHVTHIRSNTKPWHSGWNAVPSLCIIIQPRNCERDSHEWLCKAWARPPHRIFKSLKFLLVVNIVMLSAAVVTPSLSASGLLFSFLSSSLFLNLSLSHSPFSSCLPFFLAFFPLVQNLRFALPFSSSARSRKPSRSQTRAGRRLRFGSPSYSPRDLCAIMRRKSKTIGHRHTLRYSRAIKEITPFVSW